MTGFVVVGVAIFIGYVLGRIDLLGPHARDVLGKLVFYVLSPFLLFTVLAQADVAMLFSALLPVSALAATVVVGGYVLIARLWWRRPVAETLIGGLAAGQVNSNNIGIPLSLYLLGNAAFPAPVILFQLLVMTPVALAVLDAATSSHRAFLPILRRTALNPVVVGSVLGVAVSLSGWRLPEIVLEPAELVANACIPLLLISYGISLHGQRVLGSRGRRRDVLLATGLKLLAMPVVAWVLGDFVFHLSPTDLLTVVVLAALPTAQNVFNFSQRYRAGETIARDTILLTTIGCVPVLLLAVWILG